MLRLLVNNEMYVYSCGNMYIKYNSIFMIVENFIHILEIHISVKLFVIRTLKREYYLLADQPGVTRDCLTYLQF